jgi:hypothetical protein
MNDCADEQQTRHYRGKWFGFGPVRDSEHVLFAVFQDTSHAGSSLTEKSFTSNLTKTSESLARASFVTSSVFNRCIARDRNAVGIASAHVSSIRRLRADIKLNAITKKVRAICVIDKVEPGDCEGHAAMGYVEETAGQSMSPVQIGKIRKNIRMDLAREFSAIIPTEKHQWPWGVGILARRLVSIVRVLFTMFSR